MLDSASTLLERWEKRSAAARDQATASPRTELRGVASTRETRHALLKVYKVAEDLPPFVFEDKDCRPAV
jgi:hypothetical protein